MLSAVLMLVAWRLGTRVVLVLLFTTLFAVLFSAFTLVAAFVG